MNRNRRKLIPAAALVFIIVLALFAARFVREKRAEEYAGQVHGKTATDIMETNKNRSAVTFGGKRYLCREDVSAYLIMGIDKDEAESDGINTGGQADMIALVVADGAQKTYTILQLNRDTVCTVDTMSLNNKVTGSATMQLCLSHTYGDGLEASCENTVRAVSRLLYETAIAGYASFSMDVMPVINDTVGGVTVTIEDDFSRADPSLVMGETVTLNGEQAYNYLRSRMNVGDGSNLGRMRRHRTYLDAFLQKLDACVAESSDVLDEVYHAVEPYMISDMDGGDVSTLISAYTGYEFAGITAIDGETEVVDGYTEFYIDEEQLQETVLRLFYQEVEE